MYFAQFVLNNLDVIHSKITGISLVDTHSVHNTHIRDIHVLQLFWANASVFQVAAYADSFYAQAVFVYGKHHTFVFN